MIDSLVCKNFCQKIINGDEIEQNAFSLLEHLGVIMKGHFLLSSGLHSDTYLQCAKLFMYPKLAAIICTALYNKMIKNFPNINVDVIISPALGAIFCGYELSRISGAYNVFFEKNAQGIFELRRDFYISNNAVVIVAEDVVTSGGSVKKILDCLSDYKCEVLAVCSIFNRNTGNPFDFPFYSLLNMDLKVYDSNNLPNNLAFQPLYKPGSYFSKT